MKLLYHNQNKFLKSAFRSFCLKIFFCKIKCAETDVHDHNNITMMIVFLSLLAYMVHLRSCT